MGAMTHEEMLKAAEFAVEVAAEAQNLREELRWRAATNDPERQSRIEMMLQKMSAAMLPVRSARGILSWEPGPENVEKALRKASAYSQYQRKQLKKMRRK